MISTEAFCYKPALFGLKTTGPLQIYYATVQRLFL
jgi:hypothetical protein